MTRTSTPKKQYVVRANDYADFSGPFDSLTAVAENIHDNGWDTDGSIDDVEVFELGKKIAVKVGEITFEPEC